MSQLLQHDAVVVGAGPAGSVAAALLARAGWAVALLEKQSFPRRKVCGECISAGCLQLLASLGLGQTLFDDAGPELTDVALARRDREVVAHLPAAAGRVPWGRAIGREALDLLLLENARAAGASVFQPCIATGVEAPADDGMHTVYVRDGSLHRAPVLIIARGSWEAPLNGSSATQSRAPRLADDLIAFKANFAGVAHAPGQLSVLLLDGGYGGLVVQGAGIATLACCIRRDRLLSLRRSVADARAGEAVESWLRANCRTVGDELRDARRIGPWLAAGPIRPGVRLDDQAQAFRIGNAAAEAHPILGEGITMAVQSAALLCRCLLARSPQAAARPGMRAAMTRAYQDAWHRSFDRRIGLASAFGHAAMRPLPSAALMAAGGQWPGLITAGARWGGKAASPSAALQMPLQAGSYT